MTARSYEIRVIETTHGKKVHEREFKGSDTGWADVERIKDVKRTVYSQTFDEIDVMQLINAANAAGKESTK